MTKILIDEATVKLALEALEADYLAMVADGNGHMVYLEDQAITAPREALAEQPAQCAPAEDGVCEALNCPNHKPAQQQTMYLESGGPGYGPAPNQKLIVGCVNKPEQPAQRILELEALLERQTAPLERQTARIVDLQTHIENLEGEDR